MIAWLFIAGAAYAIDVNDTVRLNLDGGESVDGWFVHYEPETVSLRVPTLGETVDVQFSIVGAATVNNAPVELDSWQMELHEWHQDWVRRLGEQPFAPPPWGVAMTNGILAGSGHAWLGDWREATGMMIADSVSMGLVAWEVTHGQRLNVVVGGLAVSTVMKLYAINDGIRTARRQRKKPRM